MLHKILNLFKKKEQPAAPAVITDEVKIVVNPPASFPFPTEQPVEGTAAVPAVTTKKRGPKKATQTTPAIKAKPKK